MNLSLSHVHTYTRTTFYYNMRLRLLFLVLATTLIAENTEASLNLGPILELGIRFVLLNLKRLGTVSLGDITLTIPEDIKNISIGSIDLKGPQIYGLDTLDIAKLSATDIDSVDDSNTISLCLELLNEKLGFSSNYDADVGILDEIPIYGDGELNVAVSKTVFDLCLNITVSQDFSRIHVDDLILALGVHDSKSYITRFWENDSVSEVVTTIINILEEIVCMWLSYEKECVSCVISPLIQYVANSILPGNKENELFINCSCLQNIFGEKADLEDILEKLVTSYREGNISSLLNSINNEQLKQILRKVKSNILEILANEELNI